MLENLIDLTFINALLKDVVIILPVAFVLLAGLWGLRIAFNVLKGKKGIVREGVDWSAYDRKRDELQERRDRYL